MRFLFKLFIPKFYMSYTTDWDESSPLDHTKFKVQPSHVRDTKATIADRLKAFLYGFTAGETDTGVKYHKYMAQGTAPSTAADSIVGYAYDVDSVAEWFLADESGNRMQITNKGKLNAAIIGNLTNDVFLMSVDTTGTGTIDLIKGNASNLPELGAGAVVAGTADPASDYAIGTKKYIDAAIAAAVAAAKPDYILLRDQVSSGSAGAAPVYSTWTARRIQTEVIDTGNDCAIIGSNQFTLEAGTYELICIADILKGSVHKTRLYNITDSSTEILGMATFGNTGTYWTSTPDFLMGRFTIAAQKTFEIQYYVTSAVTLGSPLSDGTDEIYLNAQFVKVA